MSKIGIRSITMLDGLNISSDSVRHFRFINCQLHDVWVLKSSSMKQSSTGIAHTKDSKQGHGKQRDSHGRGTWSECLFMGVKEYLGSKNWLQYKSYTVYGHRQHSPNGRRKWTYRHCNFN